MTEPLFFFVLCTLLFSAFLKGTLGLGFSTICLAILANGIELKTAISIVVLPSLISNLIVMVQAGNWKISAQKFALMLLMAIPGMLLGLALLRQVDNHGSLILLALVLMSYGLWGLRNHQFRLADRHIPRFNPVVGLITGTINGATGSQIFPIMPYLLSLNISKDVLVQTINMSFTLCSLIMLAALWHMQVLTPRLMLSYSLGIMPVSIGVMLGYRVRRHLSDHRYRQAVMGLIVILGGLLLIKTL